MMIKQKAQYILASLVLAISFLSGTASAHNTTINDSLTRYTPDPSFTRYSKVQGGCLPKGTKCGQRDLHDGCDSCCDKKIRTVCGHGLFPSLCCD